MTQALYQYYQNKIYKSRKKLRNLNYSLKQQTFINCVRAKHKIFGILFGFQHYLRLIQMTKLNY